MQERILELLKRLAGQTLSLRDIVKRLGLSVSERATVRRLLRSLAAEGKILAFRNQHYSCSAGAGSVVGVLSVTTRGMGFVSPERRLGEGGETEPPDISIARQNMGSALPDDRVEVHVIREQFGRREGYVVRVLERRSETLVGRFLHQRKGGLVLPRDPRIDRNIVVTHCPPRDVLQDDQWVVARITQWTAWPEPLYGRIEDILGSDGDRGLDVLLIVRDHGVVPEFPGDVEHEAARLSLRLDRSSLENRKDLRDWFVVTIDPEQAKDFDDAVSLEMLDGGRRRLGIHIADVSHYVAEDATVDCEALERGTSIYPVDRVIPMLPERLSSDLCSLRPHEDRLTMSVIVTFDVHGEMLDYDLFRSVIRSRHRLTYRQVQDLFDAAPAQTILSFADAHAMLLAMRDLAATLAARRKNQGSLDLDIPETDVVLDAMGRVGDLRRAERWESHRLIEQFMILANEVVARHLTHRGLPVLYRVHAPPDPEKLERLRPFLKAIGVRLPAGDGPVSQRSLQRILDSLDRLEAGPILHSLVLRAMMRAAYSPKNVGHYGLASSCYCHFTSPIRRYPDLVVHRVLGVLLDHGKVAAEQIGHWREAFDEIARHSSEREERANEIERDAVKVKSLEFMRQFIGEEFDGIVSGVLSFGFFVELVQYPVEGLAHVRELHDDYYRLVEEELSLVGESSGRRFRFGDKVRVVVTRVDLINLEMDLIPVDLADEKPAPQRRGRRRRDGMKSHSSRGKSLPGR